MQLTRMTNSLAHFHQSQTQTLRGISPGVAPTGRVIRSVNRSILPKTSPANGDAIPSNRRNIIRQGMTASRTKNPKRSVNLFAMVCTGFVVGTVSSMVLCLPGGLIDRSPSRSLFAFVKSDLANKVRVVPARSVSQTREIHRAVLHDTMAGHRSLIRRAPALISDTVSTASDAGGSIGRQRIRLASFAAMPHERKSVAAPTTTNRASSNHVGTRDIYIPRGAVGRVHSIIRKYAPKHQNPQLLAEAIVAESRTQGYDPLFVAAVIKAESTFNPVARSHKGAQGLMQIMPATGAWLTKRHDLPRGKLTDTGHNLRLGISYLKQLESEYSGDKVFTLVAYNWGPGHVQSATGGKRRIPKECMTYALKILKDYERWQSGLI